jgi:outer membrane receptor protein involved in Fe transport
MRSAAALKLTRFTVVLAAGVALAWLIASVGPAGTVTAATATDTTGATDTGSGGVTRTETKTITEPARTDTVTETSTAQPPGNTTNRTVQVTPAATSTTDQSSTSGLPWWGWALIGLGAVVIGLVMFMAGRHRSSRPPSGPGGTPPPPAQGPGGYA